MPRSPLLTLLGRTALVAYTVAGYPHPSCTPDVLLGFEKAGVDIIELGNQTEACGC